MEENKKEVKVPKLRENYMETLKNGIMKKKATIAKMERGIEGLAKKIKREQKKRNDIKNKESEEYKQQDDKISRLSNNLKERTKKAERLKQQTKNTIAVVKVGIEKNIEDLNRKVLEAQNEKRNLEAEKENIETEKSKFVNNVKKLIAKSKITEDSRDAFMQTVSKRAEEIEGKLSLVKSKIIYIEAELPEYISKIKEMKDNLKYVDYDEIEKYEIKEVSEDKEDEQQEQKKEENLSDNKPLTPEEEAKKEAKQAKTETEKEKQAKKEAEERLAKKKLEKEKLAKEKEDREKAKREEKNNPYKEGEELPEEQTKGLYEEDKEKPLLYIGESVGDIIYCGNLQGKKAEKGNVQEALNEKKDLYKELNISRICREVAGNRLSSALLYRKINPRIITVIKSDPKIVYEYVKAIHNKQELPFNLVYELRGISPIKRFSMLKFTRAERKSGALVTENLFDRLSAGKINDTQKAEVDNHSLAELLDNAQILESQKTAIKDYAIINGEDKAKKEYEHILFNTSQDSHIKELMAQQENEQGKFTQEQLEKIEKLSQKGLFIDDEEDTKAKNENASFIDRVGKQDGKIEEAARKSAEKKKEEPLERFSDAEITEEDYKASFRKYNSGR